VGLAWRSGGNSFAFLAAANRFGRSWDGSRSPFSDGGDFIFYGIGPALYRGDLSIPYFLFHYLPTRPRTKFGGHANCPDCLDFGFSYDQYPRNRVGPWAGR